MTNTLTVRSIEPIPADVPRSRASIQRDALAAAHEQAMPGGATRASRDATRRRFDFDAALLALIFAGQFAVAAVGVAEAVGAAREPHVDGAAGATMASAHGEPAP